MNNLYDEKTYDVKVALGKLKIKNYLIIFDLDGTLLSTDEVNYFSYKEAIRLVKNISLDLIFEKNCRITGDKLYSIINGLTVQEYEKIINIKNNVYRKYLHKSKVNDCILNIAEFFCSENQVVLATNGRKNRIKMILKYHDLEKFFSFNFYKEDYGSNNKFMHVLKFLNASPDYVIVIENDEVEVSKAIFSGIPAENIFNISKVR